MMLDPDLLREAFSAKNEGRLESFLDGFEPLIARALHLAVTPGRAVTVVEEAFIEAEPTSEIPPPESNETWEAHRDWMLSKAGKPGQLPEPAIAEMEVSTSRVSRTLSTDRDRTYGLVVGYVQSGKTAHFTGVMARAVDLGFTFIIVLSGVLNDLRRQTQKRLVKDLVGLHPQYPRGGLSEDEAIPIHGRKFIQLLTSPEQDGDIKSGTKDHLEGYLSSAPEKGHVLLAVVKKNVLILENLMNGIKRADKDVLSGHRVLIIDDEADHATVNTGGDGSEHEDPNLEEADEEEDKMDLETDPSRTNRAVRRILSLFEKTAYIGYTATPFANVLIDEGEEDPVHGKSLYPRDFILSMRRPDNYFGPDTFFGDLGDHESDSEFTVTVSESERDAVLEMSSDEEDKRKITDIVPISLQLAIKDFILTGAARERRRRIGIGMNSHHTMLVHVTRLNTDQAFIRGIVADLFEIWKRRATSTLDSTFRGELRDRWEDEFSRTNVSWREIEPIIVDEGWMERVEIVMMNALSDEQLDYGSEGRNVICVGGNKLSRGLTLEGLCISYFVRRTRLYDSLMQMGRWFGYRGGYEDMVRVHSTWELLTWFSWLVAVEDRVRSDIKRYEIYGKTPRELSVRIPMHPDIGMMPTARNKRKAAITEIIDYRGASVQSIRLPVNEPGRLESNLGLATSFMSQLDGKWKESGRYAWSYGVSKSAVADFIGSLDLDGPPQATFDNKAIARYIRSEDFEGEGFLVMHAGQAHQDVAQAPDENPDGDPSWPIGTRYVARSQRKLPDGGSSGDLRVISEPKDFDKAESISPLSPIMLVYLIAPGSFPRGWPENPPKQRVPLADYGIPIVGIALKFPGNLDGIISKIVHVRNISGEVDG